MDQKEIPSFLKCIEGEPLLVTINRSFGGSSNYTYKFTDSKSSSQYNCLVSKQGKKSVNVTNTFRLIQDRANLWILVCDKIGNKNISPTLTAPIEYRPKINSWVLTASFDTVRALFTLNNFEDGFGLLSSLGCTYATVQFHCVTRFMTISCYGFGGFLLNQAKVDERTVDEELNQDEKNDEIQKQVELLPNKSIVISTDSITRLSNLLQSFVSK